MSIHKIAAGPWGCSDFDALALFLGAGDDTNTGGRNRYHCSYVVYTDGIYYYAENGATGELDYGGPNNEGAATGTDAQEVIQGAIDALPATGGRIYIKAGQYSIDSTLDLPIYVWLEGEGMDVGTTTQLTTLLFTMTDGTNGIEVNSAGIGERGGGIQNMRLYGQTAAGTALLLNEVSQYFIEKVGIRRWGGDGIQIQDNSNIVFIRDSEIRDTGAYVIDIVEVGADRPTDIYIEKCFLVDPTTATLHLNSTYTKCHILNCLFENFDNQNQPWIHNEGTDTRLWIRGTVFLKAGAAATGLNLDDVDHAFICNNWFDLANVGIDLDANCTNIRIRDNRFRNVTTPITSLSTDVIATGNPGYNPVAASTPAVGASPVTFGPYIYPTMIGVVGGTITSVTIRAQVTGQAGAGTFAYYNLHAGDTCIIVYTVAPTVYLYPQ